MENTTVEQEKLYGFCDGKPANKAQTYEKDKNWDVRKKWCKSGQWNAH